MYGQGTERRLYRSSRDRKLTGVSGGLGDYYGIDPTLIRIGWVLVGFATGPGVLVAYAILALLMPESPATADTYSI